MCYHLLDNYLSDISIIALCTCNALKFQHLLSSSYLRKHHHGSCILTCVIEIIKLTCSLNNWRSQARAEEGKSKQGANCYKL